MYETCVTEAIYKSQIENKYTVEVQHGSELPNVFADWLREDKDHRKRLAHKNWCDLVDFIRNSADKCFIVRGTYGDTLYIYGEHITGGRYGSLGPFATFDKSFGTFLWETYVSKTETMTTTAAESSWIDTTSGKLTWSNTITIGNYTNTVKDAVSSIETFTNEVNNVIKEKYKMETNKMFGKFDFGKVSGDKVRMSPYGLAVKNTDGIWVAYDAAAGAIMNVEVFNFDGSNFLYKVPAALNQVAIGDIVIHNRAPKFVKAINDDTLTVVDIVSGEITTILPTKSPFGFNFITKVMNLLGNITANADSPFGNMLPLMLMSDSNTNDMLPLIMMMNGGQLDMSNPLMLYALMGKGGNDMLPFLLMNGGKTNA